MYSRVHRIASESRLFDFALIEDVDVNRSMAAPFVYPHELRQLIFRFGNSLDYV